MKTTILLLTLLLSFNLFAKCEIYFHISTSGEVELSTTKAKKGHHSISQKDYRLHLKYSKEMFKPKYATMNDEQLNKAIAKKFTTTPKHLKKIYTLGMVIEDAMKKLKVK